MTKEEYWVTYEVDGFQGVREVGPYPDGHTANQVYSLIRGYQGITNVKVSSRDVPLPKPLPGAWRPSDQPSPWDQE